jgi:hypothetical protein
VIATKVGESALSPLERGPIWQILVTSEAKQAAHSASLDTRNYAMFMVANKRGFRRWFLAADTALLAEEQRPRLVWERVHDVLMKRAFRRSSTPTTDLAELFALRVDVLARNAINLPLACPGASLRRRHCRRGGLKREG